MSMIDSDVLLQLFRLQKKENNENGKPLYAEIAINQCIEITQKVADGDCTTLSGAPIPQKGENK